MSTRKRSKRQSKTLAVIKQIKVGPGLDGIMDDEPDDKIILTNHSRPIGTLTAIDPHNAYLFQPERGPAPPPPADAPPPPAGGRGRGRGPLGPIVAAWFIVITH
jgi:hypothetical protein